MMSITALIAYWKGRQSPHPQITDFKWDVVLDSTIRYLEELKRLNGEQK